MFTHPPRVRIDFPVRLVLAAILAWSGGASRTSAAEPQARATLKGHSCEVYSLAFSPDGKTLASGAGAFSSDLSPGEICLWDVATAKRRVSLSGHAGGIWSVAFSPDGKTLASASADQTVKLWDTATGKEQATLTGHRDWVRSVAFTPDGKEIASAGNDGKIKLWDVASRRERMTIPGHATTIASLAISPDGQTLVANDFDKNIRVWNLATGRETRSIPSGNISYTLAFSPDGKTLAQGGSGGTKLWDSKTWQAGSVLPSGEATNYGVAFAPDGKSLAVAWWDKVVQLWDVAKKREKATFPHGNVVLSVAISPDGKLLASGNGASAPYEVKLWDLNP